ncbi:uncharacterized protein (DUF952 family) [Amycolatopsis bartoniae]|uniref:DUF952 domain-containing protein n=1 Tax=Amycolatopsis bartoniae TaxID=941986 RepID=A0A8H9IYT1_9PSEU|nr:DUF952 domain-containing protein [Amycolatopsis bartoniae]MBB2933341.1 uncharacterized protein (DUF952 family) [Amycolatopsis bartoniae]TVT08055.1 DUF952 domain-containing protein [Amycolatopsis bartoniae]GHF58831.1 hypothetical protein GCM10017566_35250 [Amycolatopsis bartoniae]
MILHICAEADWTGGEYRPSSLDTAGFVHCSDPGTTHLPANALYAGRTDLVLLEIDPARLGVPVRWEEGDPPHPAGIWFPHVYGPIRPEAVVAVHPFPPGPDGLFRLPDAVANR